MRACIKPAVLGAVIAMAAALSSCSSNGTSHTAVLDMHSDIRSDDFRSEEYGEPRYSHECRTCHDQDVTYFVLNIERDDPGLLL